MPALVSRANEVATGRSLHKLGSIDEIAAEIVRRVAITPIWKRVADEQYRA